MQQSPPQARHDTEQRAQRDGCDCWGHLSAQYRDEIIVRCTHVGNGATALFRLHEPPNEIYWLHWCLDGRQVYPDEEMGVYCWCLASSVEETSCDSFNTLPEAEAAFDAAVMRLLREAE